MGAPTLPTIGMSTDTLEADPAAPLVFMQPGVYKLCYHPLGAFDSDPMSQLIDVNIRVEDPADGGMFWLFIFPQG